MKMGTICNARTDDKDFAGGFCQSHWKSNGQMVFKDFILSYSLIPVGLFGLRYLFIKTETCWVCKHHF